ncbi:hypothetical protein GQ600_17358 [Phytophthora cactorum]|nr:hypothetical protein GQ600_17358 [Phytophthora cactorum]
MVRRKCWNYSAIGRSIYSTIPPETHFIGDAGYGYGAWWSRAASAKKAARCRHSKKRFNFLHVCPSRAPLDSGKEDFKIFKEL